MRPQERLQRGAKGNHDRQGAALPSESHSAAPTRLVQAQHTHLHQQERRSPAGRRRGGLSGGRTARVRTGGDGILHSYPPGGSEAG